MPSTLAPGLDRLTDVHLDSVADNEVLQYNSTTGRWENAAVAASELGDITITSPADNEVLAYDNGSSEWINQTAAEAGLATASHTHTLADVTDVTASITEINYVDGVTSAIQTQLDAKQASDADLTALAALDATAGMLARTGAGTFAVRTLTGTANEISVANGDGSGTPTFSIPATFAVGTTPSLTITEGVGVAIVLGVDAADDFTVGSTFLVVEGDRGYVGIGTAAPYTPLDVADVDTSVNVTLKRIDASIGTNDVIGNLRWAGTDGFTEASPGLGAAIIGVARENWSGSGSGGQLIFATTANAATSLTNRMSIDQDGAIAFESGALSGAASLNIDASGNVSFAGTAILSDSAGTMTLGNVDAIDATTEATLEAAIDALSNLVTVGALDSGSITSGFGNIDVGASSISAGSFDASEGNITNVGDIALDSLTADGTTITVNSHLILSLATQDYEIADRTSLLTLQSKTAGQACSLELFPNDGDGTDNTNLHLYGVGTPASVTNRERLVIRYEAAGPNFLIKAEAAGTGTLRPLVLETKDNANQILLNTDGTTTFGSGDVSFSDNGITNVGDISLDTINSDGSTVVIGSGTTMTFTDDGAIDVVLAGGAGDNWTIDSTGVMYEGDTGDFGIGIAPTSRFHCYETVNGDMIANFSNPNAGNAARAIVRLTNDASTAAVQYHGSAHSSLPRDLQIINNDGAGGIEFYFNGANRFTLGQDGNVSLTDHLTIGAPSQDYEFADRSNLLTLQSKSASNAMALEMFSSDGDGTDDVGIQIYGKGSPASITNRERMIVKYEAASTRFLIQSEADGTGTVRTLVLETEGNGDQLHLATNGNVGINKAPNSAIDIDLATQDLEIVDAGNAGATEQAWVEVEVNGVQGWLRVYAGI